MITGSKDTWGQMSPLDERSSLYTVGTGSLGRVLALLLRRSEAAPESDELL